MVTDLALENIAKRIKEFGGRENVRSLHFPEFTEEDSRAVAKVVESGFVSTYGEQTRLLEEKLSNLLGGKVVATNSGTSALHLAVLTLGVGPGDIVFCPAISFVATANALIYAGATPYFVDVDENLMISADVLSRELKRNFKKRRKGWVQKSTGLTARAIIVLHPMGTILETSKISDIASEFELQILEDGAQALGAGFGRSKHLGELGRLAAISFNGNKILTTGAGGALLAKNDEDYHFALKLATVGRQGGPSFEIGHDAIGFNYRMPALNAALGLSALDRLEATLVRKREIRAFYHGIASEFNLDLLHRAEGNSNFWINVLGLPSELGASTAAEILNEMGIGVRRIWTPLPGLKHLSNYESSDLSMTRKVFDRYLCFPSSPAMVKG